MVPGSGEKRFLRWGPERCRVAARMVARSGGNWEKFRASQSIRG